MKKSIYFILFSFVAITYCGCAKSTPVVKPEESTKKLFSLNIDPTALPLAFSANTIAYTIDKNLPEVSGILFSRRNKNVLWAEEDSGNGQFLYVYSTTGHQEKKIALLNTMTHDAEDIGYGPDKDGHYNRVFLADIGDNNNKRSTVDIYTFREPDFLDSTSIPSEMTAENKIRLKYPDYPGIRENAEAMFVDPTTNRMYIFSKQASTCHVYTLDFPYDYNSVNTLKYVGDINIRFERVTAADISPDGMYVLLKTYEHIFYWKRESGEDLNKTFTRMPELVPYQGEVQGEAVTWGNVPDEYFTFSEADNNVVPKLFQYIRK